MRLAFTLMFFALCGIAIAQVPDSVSARYDSLLRAKSTKLDSTTDRTNQKIDGIQSRVNTILNPELSKLTSRFRRKNVEVPDTVQAIHELDSMKTGLNHKIDSLRSINLPTDKYTKQLDSLKQLSPTKYIEQAERKAAEVQDKINKPIGDVANKINDPINKVEDKINKPIDNIESKVNDKLTLIKQEGGENLPGNLNTKDIGLGNTNLPNADITKDLNVSDKLNLPNTKIDANNPLGNVTNPLNGDPGGNLGDIKGKVTDLKSAPSEQLSKIKSAEELQSIQKKAGALNSATDKVQAYGEDAKSIANGNLGEVKAIPDAIEEKAKNMDQLGELSKQTAEMEKMKGIIPDGNNPDAMKEMVQQQVVQQARDHFAGKEEMLKAAMDKVSKLKEKYPEVSSLKDLPKRAPNPMKGKPLIERIIPGVTLQIQKEANVLVDLNPVVSYRFTGRLNAGLGWNERLSFAKWNKLSSIDRVYGPRVFGSFAFRKGFALKAEIEKMNAFIPPFSINPDAGSRQWLWSAFVGIKKDYKFIKSVHGNIQLLYNIYDDKDSSPYVERLNVRMGFEFPMKKRKKPVAK